MVTVAANVGTKGKRSVWTSAEDASLRTLVLAEKTDPPNWAYIATQMPNRSGKQVRDRYTQVLDPSIKARGSWTAEEDRIIVQHVEQWGPGEWSAIARKLPGRSGQQVQNRWKWKLAPTATQTSGKGEGGSKVSGRGGEGGKGSEKTEGEVGGARAQAAVSTAGTGRGARRGDIADKVLVVSCLRVALGVCLGVV